MQTVTPKRMRELEQNAEQQFGIPPLLLMEHAAIEVAKAAYSMGKRALFVCGMGNNGGDGFGAARLFLQMGGDCGIVLVGRSQALEGLSAQQLAMARSLGISVGELASEDMLPAFAAALSEVDVLVDALLGTGLSREVEGLQKQVILAMNEAGKPIVAVDIPSGIDGRNGAVRGAAICATRTVTFAYVKPGHLLFPGREYTGHLVCKDIGLPKQAGEPDGPEWIMPVQARKQVPKRPLSAHKNDFGHGLIVAGSRSMPGAAVMTARAALGMGAGLVTVCSPVSAMSAIQAHAPEAMTIGLEEQDGAFSLGCEIDLRTALCAKDAVAVGPGMTQKPGCTVVLRTVLGAGLPCVVDADGLNVLSRAMGMLETVRHRAVLTPHPGEMARLCDCTVAQVLAEPVERATALAKEHEVVVLLKGATTVIASWDGRVALNTTGTPGMATGGSGDVLTGMILALMAQGLAGYEAACTAAALHGIAGERAAEREGVVSMTAMGIVRELGRTLGQLEG